MVIPIHTHFPDPFKFVTSPLLYSRWSLQRCPVHVQKPVCPLGHYTASAIPVFFFSPLELMRVSHCASRRRQCCSRRVCPFPASRKPRAVTRHSRSPSPSIRRSVRLVLKFMAKQRTPPSLPMWLSEALPSTTHNEAGVHRQGQFKSLFGEQAFDFPKTSSVYKDAALSETQITVSILHISLLLAKLYQTSQFPMRGSALFFFFPF